MTVAAQTPTISYLENGSTTAFAVPFRYDSPADLRATRLLANGTQVTLVNGTDFTATPGPTNAGGTLTLTAAGPAGARLTIIRQTARAQTADYVTNGPFDAESHERALDKAMLVNQEQDTDLARAFKVPLGEVGPSLPPAASRAGRIFAFDGTGASLLDITADDVRQAVAAVFNPQFVQLASLVMFLAPGPGTEARPVQEKLGEFPSITDYISVAAADAAPGAKYVPAGIHDTTLTSAQIEGVYYGDGQIRDAGGNLRAPWFSAVTSAPSSFGNQDSIETIANGDLSKTQIFMEHRITGAGTLGEPSSGYLNRPECYPFVGALHIGQDAGYQASAFADTSRTNGTFFFNNVYHYGRGDGISLTSNIFVAGNNSATDSLAFPAGLCLAGQVTAGANDVNCNPIEVNALDGGFNASLQSIIGNVYRENSSTAKRRYVFGARMQSQGTMPGDAAFSVQGLWKSGLDLTALMSDANKGAITMRQGDRIYFGASTSTGFYVTSYGGDWIEKTGFGVMNFAVANEARLQLGDSVECFFPLRLPRYTVAQLSALPPLSGRKAYVTDSNAPATGNFGAIVAGGGSNTVPVFGDGTNWRIG